MNKEWRTDRPIQIIYQQYENIWREIFNIAKLGNANKPLTPKILSDPKHQITKHLVYIYSMESFLYTEMNNASRTQDKSKIEFYGPIAAALGYIIQHANTNRGHNDKLWRVLYRGTKRTLQEIENLEVGSSTNLAGFTSTTKSKTKAL